MNNLQHIVAQFKIKGRLNLITPIEMGHINLSYFVQNEGNAPNYFLQKINHSIFKDVDGLMRNIEAVTQHLKKKNVDGKVLELIPTNTGELYFGNHEAGYWRLYNYVTNSHSYNLVTEPAIAYEGGKAFGQFITNLADFDAKKLTETIPDFHHLGKRLAKFYTTLERDPANRVETVAAEIKFIADRTESMFRIPKLIEEGKLPLRVTHNDTKFNNVLFNSENKAICVVDLDTVMPGSVLFDFGDAIRTGANTAQEDEKDLSKVDINLPIFEAYASGFIHETKQILNDVELKNLAFSAQFMTYIIGLRFLTDYIDGDNYFHTAYTDHNLVRARVQFKLIEAMEKHGETMNAIVINARQDDI